MEWFWIVMRCSRFAPTQQLVYLVSPVIGFVSMYRSVALVQLWVLECRKFGGDR
jgi:hypothetical protein